MKLRIVHVLGDNKEDIWEYSAALNPEKSALTTVPFGLHYRQDTVTSEWVETYYEDGDAVFTLNDAGMLLWSDLKEDAGKTGVSQDRRFLWRPLDEGRYRGVFL